MIGTIKYFLKFLLFRRAFSIKNKHNKTFPKNFFSLNDVEIWIGTYGPLRIIWFGMTGEKLTIWSYCSIAQNVEFLLGWNHNYKRFSTYPFGILSWAHGAWERESNTKWPIIVCDDVWLAYGCKILSGVSIWKGAIVSAFSVVTKDVPPYSIVGWVPAKILKYRFSPDIITVLQKLPPMNHISIDKLLSNYDTIVDIQSLEDIRGLDNIFLVDKNTSN